MAELNEPKDSLPARMDRLEESVDYIQQVLQAQLIMLMRLYDIELAALTRADSDFANQIADSHSSGRLLANFDIILPSDE